MSLLLALLLCIEITASRITELLPDMQDPLAVEPALPADFVMNCMDKGSGLFQGILWARKNDVGDILKSSDKVSHVFIVVSYSRNIFQIGPFAFSGEKEFEIELFKAGFKDVVIKKLSWGSYPVLAMEAVNAKTGRKSYSAWVGLNSKSVSGDGLGSVLVFNFFYPDEENEPTGVALAVWEHFLQETKQLPETPFLQMHGVYMHDDYTLYDKGGIKIKIIAERLKSSGELRVIAEPLNQNSEFEVIQVSEIDGNNVRVSGEAIYSYGSDTDVVDLTLDVVVKDVYTNKFKN